MKFELDPLPYAKDSLAPHLTPETLSFHYEKHHQAYMNNLKNLLTGKPEAEKSLTEIVKSLDRRHLQQCGADLEPRLLLEVDEAQRRR